MPDYQAIRKDIYERFHDTIEKLYVSELKDQIADKDEVITAQDHMIADLQAEIEGMRVIINGLQRQLEHAEWLVDKYRQDE